MMDVSKSSCHRGRGESSPLREFIATLGEGALYPFDRKVIRVLVNYRRLWPSAKLSPAKG